MTSILLLVGILTAIAAAVVFQDWRRGVLLFLVFGVLQDVFRKFAPGAPAWFVGWSAGIFVLVALSAMINGRLAAFRELYFGRTSVRNLWVMFIVIVSIQLVHSLVRWANPMMPVLGAMFYFGPVIALLVAIAYAKSEASIRRFLLSYIFIMAPAALTIYLSSWFGDNYTVLRDIGTFTGEQLVIYDVGTAFTSNPGILRVGEIAAWHAATASIFLMILAAQSRRMSYKILSGLLIALLIGAIILTGRRKMLMALAIFLGVQWSMILYFRRGGWGQALPILFLGVFAAVVINLVGGSEKQSVYLVRSTSVFGDAWERFLGALDLLKWAIIRSSGLGLGAGTTAQGTQHFGGSLAAAGGSAEAGLGKIVVELGLPGFVILVSLVLAIAGQLLAGLRMLAETNQKLLFYAISFIAFIVANIATFSVAAQLFGDLFILLILGMSAGFLFAIIKQGRTIRQLRNLAVYQRLLHKPRFA